MPRSEYRAGLLANAREKLNEEAANPEESWKKLSAEFGFSLSKTNAPGNEELERAVREGRSDMIIALVVSSITQTSHFVTFKDNEQIFYYKDGVFRPGGESLIKQKIVALLGAAGGAGLFRGQLVRDILLGVSVATYADRSEFSRRPELIVVENGTLNLLTGELLENSPEHKCLVRVPVPYDQKTDCPNFRKFLSEVVAPENVPLIEEMLGYCLYRSYPFHKAFMLVGDGNNGKSTLILVFRAMLGEENVVNIPLQDLEQSHFAKGNLYGKLANLCPDLSARAMKTTGTFKMMTGGDAITADKKFKDMFSFVSYAKLVYSANQVPDVEDESGAFFRRWILVNFPNSFEGREDRDLAKKLTTQEELSGVLNLAVSGLQRLIANGKFTDERSTEETRLEYRRKASSVSAFQVDVLEIDSTSELPKQEVYSAYCAYCRNGGLPAVSEDAFWRKLVRLVEYSTQRLGSARVPGVRGLKLKKQGPLGVLEDG